MAFIRLRPDGPLVRVMQTKLEPLPVGPQTP
jgi:hypothetical protein